MIRSLATVTVAFSFAALCSTGDAAQTQETKTVSKTKVELKGGKDVTVRGCLDRTATGEYELRDVRDARRDERLAHDVYVLVSETDLSKHVGTRVEIKGNAVEDGHGKVSIESKVKAEGAHRADEERTTKAEATSGATLLPYLGIRSIKMLSSSCR